MHHRPPFGFWKCFWIYENSREYRKGVRDEQTGRLKVKDNHGWRPNYSSDFDLFFYGIIMLHSLGKYSWVFYFMFYLEQFDLI